MLRWKWVVVCVGVGLSWFGFLCGFKTCVFVCFFMFQSVLSCVVLCCVVLLCCVVVLCCLST